MSKDLIDRLNTEADLASNEGVPELASLLWEAAASLGPAMPTLSDLVGIIPNAYYMDPPDGGDVPLIEQLRRMADDAEKYRAALAQRQLVPYFNRRAVEQAIRSAENPPAGSLQLNDGKERVTLPGGTLRRMLSIIDMLSASPQAPAQPSEPAAPSAQAEPQHSTTWSGDCPHWCKACATERAERAAQAEPVVTLESATRAIAHLSLSNSPGREAEARAMLAERPQGPAARPDALTWYDGAPPFPQDQEWFIAETIRGDRVVLRSMDEGREHKGNYAFKTADETYMKAEIVKRWMQFPDCDYVPPEANPNSPWLTEAHMLCSDHGIPAGHITERLRSLRNKLTEQTTKPLTERQKAVLSFLYGTGTISGVGFDQKPPGVTANYWWRYELAEAFPELRATAKQEQS